MRNNFAILKILLHMLQQAGVMMLFTCFAEVICLKETPDTIYILYMLLFYIVSYLARCKLPNNLTILLTHLLCGGVVILLPVTVNLKYVFVIVIIKEMVAAMLYAKNGIGKQTKEVPWPRFLFCFVMYLYGFYDKSTYLAESAYYFTLILLVLYLVTIYVEGVESYMRSNTATAGLPIGEIIKSNSLMVGITIGLLFLCILVGKISAPGQDMSAIMKGLYTAVGGFMAGVFFFFRFWISLFIGNKKQSGNKKGPIEGEMKGPEDYEELFDNMDVVLYPLFYFLLLFVVYKLLKFIIKKLMTKRVYQGDIIEKIETADRKNHIEKRKKDSVFIMSGDEKIRRMYKQRVKRERDIIRLENNYSVREIDKIIEEKTGYNITECTDTYSDVRYGGKKADKTLINKMKKITKV